MKRLELLGFMKDRLSSNDFDSLFIWTESNHKGFLGFERNYYVKPTLMNKGFVVHVGSELSFNFIIVYR